MPAEVDIVPVETETIQFRPEVALPGIAIDAALKVPLHTAIVLVPAVGAFIVTVLPTLRLLVPLIVIPLVAEGGFMVRVEQTSAPSTVITFPL